MSNPLAIAAVTATLQALLTEGITADPDLADTTVTTQALDRARGNINSNQLNLFLYQTQLSAAWRNRDMPDRVRPGETGVPPLGLNLHYLITAYGRDNDAGQPFSHHVLGRAMSILHDHPVLGAEEIKAATAAAMPGSDLDRQIERVRLTPHPLSTEEIFRLWSGFQTQYRLSVAYEAAVVLIESAQAVRTPLPVLARGPADQGVGAQPDLIPPFPAITEVLPPDHAPSARLGDTVLITGFHLSGDAVRVHFVNPTGLAPQDIAAAAGATDQRVSVQIPANAPTQWTAGVYALSAIISRAAQPDRVTNALPLALAPRVLSIAPNPTASGDITFTVTCAPQVLPDQRAALLLGDREIPAEPHGTPSGTLTFVARGIPAGTYFIRLRVDGVDSVLVDRTVSPPAFDQTQRVTVT